MARAIGINHVALEVGDLDAALSLLRRAVRPGSCAGASPGMAFVDLGDQFLALSEGRGQPRDDARHFGLVVDDKAAVRATPRRGSASSPCRGRRLDFFDPWGNRVEVVEYGDIQFTKADHVLAGMGVGGLEKSERALAELAEKGLAP